MSDPSYTADESKLAEATIQKLRTIKSLTEAKDTVAMLEKQLERDVRVEKEAERRVLGGR